MRKIEFPSRDSSEVRSLEGLPQDWQIPLTSIKIMCHGNRPFELGRGGFGSVLLGIIRAEKAAIKIVKGGDASSHARFLHEIKLLEKPKSAHIVQFFGYSIAPRGVLLCMEYLPGGTLYESLHRNGEFQWYNR